MFTSSLFDLALQLVHLQHSELLHFAVNTIQQLIAFSMLLSASGPPLQIVFDWPCPVGRVGLPYCVAMPQGL